MMEQPEFRAGRNMAMKVPAHEYDSVAAFYRETLGLPEIGGDAASATPSCRFEFGDKVLWIDRVEGISQAEIWLEIVADDVDRASEWLASRGCVRCDEIEPLPVGFKGFWISAPGNMIHLVSHETET